MSDGTPKRPSRKPPRRPAKAPKRSARSAPPAASHASSKVKSARRPAAAKPQTDWREQILAQIRSLIHAALPEVIEERKWRKPSNAMAGVPVWSHHGIICTGESYKAAVKLTFARGASLPDPSRLFNASLAGGTRRAIDIGEHDTLDAHWKAAFQALIKAAAAENASA